jgi:hypothetical protein
MGTKPDKFSSAENSPGVLKNSGFGSSAAEYILLHSLEDEGRRQQ